MKKFLIAMTITLGAYSLNAQSTTAKATIEVDGVCGMCKARIEKAAVKTKGVKTASWDVATHELSLIYNQKKTNLEAIQRNIADVGHDTELFKAPDEAYEAIDMCCKYRDPKVVEDHKDGGH